MHDTLFTSTIHRLSPSPSFAMLLWAAMPQAVVLPIGAADANSLDFQFLVPPPVGSATRNAMKTNIFA